MAADRTSGAGAVTTASHVAVVRRYWWLVLTIVALSVAAVVAAHLTATTTYTARTSLIHASNARGPEEDAVLVQGDVVYFNDSAYQSQLLADPAIEDGVTLEARSAAASPILLVDATATDAEAARAGAAAAAEALQRDVNGARRQRNETAIADLEERINALRVAGDDSNAAVAQITEMQDRILQLQSDQANMLQELQLDAGVTQNSPALVNNLGAALLGGLLLGLLAAWAAEGMSGWLRGRPRRRR